MKPGWKTVLGIAAILAGGAGATAGTIFKWDGNGTPGGKWEDEKNWGQDNSYPGEVAGDDRAVIEMAVNMPVVFNDDTTLGTFNSRSICGLYMRPDNAAEADLELEVNGKAELYPGQVILRGGTERLAIIDVNSGTFAPETLLLDGTREGQYVRLEISVDVSVSTRTVIEGDVRIAVDTGATFDAGQIIIKGGEAGTTLSRIENPAPGTQGYGVMHSS